MSIDLLLICITIYALFGRYMRAKSKYVEELAHKLEIENDRRDYE